MPALKRIHPAGIIRIRVLIVEIQQHSVKSIVIRCQGNVIQLVPEIDLCIITVVAVARDNRLLNRCVLTAPQEQSRADQDRSQCAEWNFIHQSRYKQHTEQDENTMHDRRELTLGTGFHIGRAPDDNRSQRQSAQ
jgi:hypothetical protein